MESCLSAGRYCSMDYSETITGDKIIFQILNNLCAEKIIKENSEDHQMKIMEYYFKFFNSCAKQMDQNCPQAILKSMDLADKMQMCLLESLLGTPKYKDRPDFFLNDNKLMNKEKQNFANVENFSRFPLLKVNGIVYYGPLDIPNVFKFVCKHVREDLHGCSDYVIAQNSGKYRLLFVIIVIITVALFIMITLNSCRSRLKVRLETEMSYKVDESINKFLESQNREHI